MGKSSAVALEEDAPPPSPSKKPSLSIKKMKKQRDRALKAETDKAKRQAKGAAERERTSAKRRPEPEPEPESEEEEEEEEGSVDEEQQLEEGSYAGSELEEEASDDGGPPEPDEDPESLLPAGSGLQRAGSAWYTNDPPPRLDGPELGNWRTKQMSGVGPKWVRKKGQGWVIETPAEIRAPWGNGLTAAKKTVCYAYVGQLATTVAVLLVWPNAKNGVPAAIYGPLMVALMSSITGIVGMLRGIEEGPNFQRNAMVAAMLLDVFCVALYYTMGPIAHIEKECLPKLANATEVEFASMKYEEKLCFMGDTWLPLAVFVHMVSQALILIISPCALNWICHDHHAEKLKDVFYAGLTGGKKSGPAAIDAMVTSKNRAKYLST